MRRRQTRRDVSARGGNSWRARTFELCGARYARSVSRPNERRQSSFKLPDQLFAIMPSSDAIVEAADTSHSGAVRAAVIGAVTFHSVADDSAPAVGAFGGERVDGALEGVEGMARISHRDGKRLVVIVPAHLALGHCLPRWFGEGQLVILARG